MNRRIVRRTRERDNLIVPDPLRDCFLQPLEVKQQKSLINADMRHTSYITIETELQPFLLILGVHRNTYDNMFSVAWIMAHIKLKSVDRTQIPQKYYILTIVDTFIY